MDIQPNWDLAPEWANFFSVDANGAMYWFQNQPQIFGCAEVWDAERPCKLICFGHIRIANDGEWEFPSWRDSLRRKP